MTRTVRARPPDIRQSPQPGEVLARRCAICPLRCAELCRIIADESPQGTRPAMSRRFDAGKVVFPQGEPAGFFGILRRGYLRHLRMRPNGDHVLMGLACPGDIVGGPTITTSPCAVEASTAIELCAFDSRTLNQLMRGSPRFRRVIAHDAERQHQRLQETAWRLSALNSRERIVSFIVAATEIMPTEPRPDGSLIVNIEVPRRDWADLTNTALETISRTIGDLVERNLLVSLTPSRFLIRDLGRLALLAGVDPPRVMWNGRDRALRTVPGTTERMTAVNATGRKVVSLDFAARHTTGRRGVDRGGRPREDDEKVQD